MKKKQVQSEGEALKEGGSELSTTHHFPCDSVISLAVAAILKPEGTTQFSYIRWRFSPPMMTKLRNEKGRESRQLNERVEEETGERRE